MAAITGPQSEYGINCRTAFNLSLPWRSILLIHKPCISELIVSGRRVMALASGWLSRLISQGGTSGGSPTIKAIGVAPADPNTVYAGTSDGKVQMTSECFEWDGGFLDRP